MPYGSPQLRHPQCGRTSQRGGMGNVVNTIVRMFTRKAVRKAMKSAKKGKQDGGHKERSKKRRQEQEGHRLREPLVPEKEARATWVEEESRTRAGR